jgi:hypothetical protein
LQPPLLAGAPAVQPLPLPPAALHVSHVSAEPESAEQLRERERVAALASGFTPGATLMLKFSVFLSLTRGFPIPLQRWCGSARCTTPSTRSCSNRWMKPFVRA